MAYKYRAILNSVSSSGGPTINFDTTIERAVVGEDEWTNIVHRDFDFDNQVILDIVQSEMTGAQKLAAMSALILAHPIIKTLTEGNEAEVSVNTLVNFPVTIPLNV